MGWNHVVIEAFCLAREDADGKYPCGESCPSSTCLPEGHCPHFAWAKSNEREASLFVPLWMILKDKTVAFAGETWGKITWFAWGQWFHDPNWIDKYPVVTCPEIDKMEIANASRFALWREKCRDAGLLGLPNQHK